MAPAELNKRSLRTDVGGEDKYRRATSAIRGKFLSFSFHHFNEHCCCGMFGCRRKRATSSAVDSVPVALLVSPTRSSFNRSNGETSVHRHLRGGSTASSAAAEPDGVGVDSSCVEDT